MNSHDCKQICLITKKDKQTRLRKQKLRPLSGTWSCERVTRPFAWRKCLLLASHRPTRLIISSPVTVHRVLIILLALNRLISRLTIHDHVTCFAVIFSSRHNNWWHLSSLRATTVVKITDWGDLWLNSYQSKADWVDKLLCECLCRVKGDNQSHATDFRC